MRARLGELLLLTAALASAMRAEPPPDRPGGGPFLLAAPGFQKELKLTPDQAGKVEAVLRGLSDRHREELATLRTLAPPERSTRTRALLKAMNREVKSGLALTPSQARRFDQVLLQHRRFEAFGDPEVVTRLKLTEAQRRQIQGIARDSKDRMQRILRDAASDRARAMKRAATLSREMAAEVVDLFTDDQKAVWTEMTGDPFEVREGDEAPDARGESRRGPAGSPDRAAGAGRAVDRDTG